MNTLTVILLLGALGLSFLRLHVAAAVCLSGLAVIFLVRYAP